MVASHQGRGHFSVESDRHFLPQAAKLAGLGDRLRPGGAPGRGASGVPRARLDTARSTGSFRAVPLAGTPASVREVLSRGHGTQDRVVIAAPG